MADPRRWQLAGMLVPITALASWQLLTSAGVLHFGYLPAPVGILGALAADLRSGELPRAAAHTLGVVGTASALTLTIGTAFGLAIGLSPRLRGWVEASIDALRTVPAVTLIPVAVLTFGPTTGTEVVLVTYAALWPMVLNTAGAPASVPPRRYDVARTLHLTKPDTLRKMVVPAVTPVWLVGARLSVIVALLVAVVVEMVLTPNGLGGALVESLNALAPERMWAYALVCGLIGTVLNIVLRGAVRIALPGHPATAGSAPPITRIPVAPLRGLLPLACLLLVWQVSAPASSLTMPPPTQWLSALSRLHAEGSLAPAVGHTVAVYLLGLAAATVLGGTVGVLIGASRRIDRALSPTIDFLAAIPGAALVPVLVLLLGPNLLSAVAAVAVVVAWPILLSTATARRAIPPVRLEMSQSLGLAKARHWHSVVLPALTPDVLLGVRVASALALIIALLTDIFGAGSGIGRLLVESQQRFDAAAAWGLLLIAGGFGYLTSLALSGIADLVTPGPAARGFAPKVRTRHNAYSRST